jgi:hypothetical protein
MTPVKLLSPVRLIGPPDDSHFVGKDAKIVLRWEWDGTLQENQHYLFEAKFTGIDESRICRQDWLYFKWTKADSFVLEPWFYDVMCPSSDKRTVQWTVYVGVPADVNDLGNYRGAQLSEKATPRNFWWIIPADSNDNGTVIVTVEIP